MVKPHLRVVAADSGAAILNDNYKPLQVVAASAVLVEPPYAKATSCLAEPIFANVETGPRLIIHELELCSNLLKNVKADVVHLDMSLGSLSLEELSAVSLTQMRISGRARGHILMILPKIRRIGLDIKRLHDIEVLAIGKESVPVRIAELTSGAHAVLYTADKAVEQKTKLKLGLPAKCHAKIVENSVYLHSLVPSEQNISGCAKDEAKVLEKVQTVEMHNPVARGFRVLEITPKT